MPLPGHDTAWKPTPDANIKFLNFLALKTISETNSYSLKIGVVVFMYSNRKQTKTALLQIPFPESGLTESLFIVPGKPSSFTSSGNWGFTEALKQRQWVKIGSPEPTQT